MILHDSLINKTRKDFSKTSRVTGETWYLPKYVSIGTFVLGGREVIIPVIEREGFTNNSWGVVPSKRGKPKISSGVDNSPGVLCVISTYRSGGNGTGDVYVLQGDRGNVEVLAHGIGGKTSTKQWWHEYALAIYKPSTLLVLGSCAPDEIWEYDGEGVVITQYPSYRLDDFVNLSGDEISTWWNRENGKKED